MTVWYAKIPVPPEPKGRPKFTRTGRTYTPYKTALREKEIRDFMATQTPTMFLGPCRVDLVLWFRRARTNKHRFHVIRPDLDNCTKLVLDALNGLVWKDDSQICRLCSTKVYCDDTVTEPCIEIRVTEMCVPELNRKGEANEGQKNEVPKKRRNPLQRRSKVRPREIAEQTKAGD